ncbi:hypothetical protein HMI56_004982 [Coelomomyces lativittatus]|nr:hypothetical protein HMI56_004982 [Coelomomyces lativittatus]
MIYISANYVFASIDNLASPELPVPLIEITLREAKCIAYFVVYSNWALVTTTKGPISWDYCKANCPKYIIANCPSNEEGDFKIFWDIVEGKAVFLPLQISPNSHITEKSIKFHVSFGNYYNPNLSITMLKSNEVCEDYSGIKCKTVETTWTKYGSPNRIYISTYYITSYGYYFHVALSFGHEKYVVVQMPLKSSKQGAYYEVTVEKHVRLDKYVPITYTKEAL